MSARLVVAAVVSLTFCAPVAYGQRASEGPEAKYVDRVAGLDLDGAVARALAAEPSVEATRHDVDVARGLHVQAGLRPNPVVGFGQQNEPGGMGRQTRVDITWPLELFRRAGRLGVAGRELEAARQTLADRERLLAADVRSQYGTVAAGIRELGVLGDLVQAISKQHALVSARVSEGAAPPLERDLLEVELRRLESERLLRTGAVEGQMIELKRLLGMRAGDSLRLAEDLEQLVSGETRAPLAGDPAEVADRPDVAEARTRVALAEAGIERARREGRPDVSLFAMYMRMDAGFPQLAFGRGGGLERIEGRFHNVAAGAMVTVPVRDRRQGDLAAARARRLAASASLEAAELAASGEVAAARARDEHARLALRQYTTDARHLARRNLDVVSQAYDLGRATIFDVLAEQRRYLELERAFTDVLNEAFQARQALRRATGAVR